MGKVIQFFKSAIGRVLIFAVAIFVCFYFVRQYRERSDEKKRLAQKQKTREDLLGRMSPEVKKLDPARGELSTIVENEDFVSFRPYGREEEQAQQSEKKENSSKPKLPTLIHYYESTTEISEIKPPKIFAPTGTLIPCVLVNTIDSSKIETPIIGMVTKEIWHNENLIIPAGTLVQSIAQNGRSRDRIEANGTWRFVWHDGRELTIPGIALDRVYNHDLNDYGITDGSAGIKGTMERTDESAEIKLFLATLISGFAEGSQQKTTSFFGTSQEGGFLNGGLEGVNAVMERYAEMLLEQMEEGFFVRAAAGTEFYIFIKKPFEPEMASVANLKQGIEPLNSWEIGQPKELISSDFINPTNTVSSKYPTRTPEEILEEREKMKNRIQSFLNEQRKENHASKTSYLD